MSNRVDPGVSIVQNSVQNSGLATPATDEFLAELASALPARIRHRIAPFDHVDSTNRIARELAQIPDGESDIQTNIVLADLQSAGRGRLGRGWYSERGQSLAASFIVRLRGGLGGGAVTGTMLPIAAAVATAEAVESAIKPIPVAIKWPNDLIAGGGKVSGILIEAVGAGVFVVGIGINVGRMLFPDDIARRAVSVSDVAGRDVSRMHVLAALIRQVDGRCADLSTGDGSKALLDAYRSRLVDVGCEVALKRTADSTAIRGRLVGIQDDGALVLETGAGRETFYAGDLTSDLTSDTRT